MVFVLSCKYSCTHTQPHIHIDLHLDKVISISQPFAMQSISALKCPVINWFLPRDAVRKRGLCCRPVYLSVCLSLSHWWIVSRRLKISSNFFIGHGSPITIFLTPSAGTQFQRELLQHGRKIHGVVKFCDFRLKSPFIFETVRDRPVVAMEVIDVGAIRVGSDDLEWPHNPDFKVTTFFDIEYLRNDTR